MNHYETLGIEHTATLSEIKRAFREKAKQLHPDITGAEVSTEMHRLLEAYEVLSDRERRFQYDKIFHPFGAATKKEFDYRVFLKEHEEDPEYQAKLIFFDLFHFEEDDAVAVWQAAGGMNFPLEKFLDREDWMDCGFILAEELERHGCFYETFLLLIQLLQEERRKPYFRHFTEDVELFLKEIVRFKLRRAVSPDTWMHCMRSLIGLGFPAKDEARWLKSIAEVHKKRGDLAAARAVMDEARERNPSISLKGI
ncbi:MAG: J domain-containing protein [Spirochaetaceae bacterium]|jgi:curved DNA-binding protein CbpA|nr:J domain-containing protein [Spirochaetaceae bacterium]